MKKTFLTLIVAVSINVCTKAQSISVLHDFGNNAANGLTPKSTLISDGTFLYGTTYDGGNGGSNNNGTIFKIKPDGTSYTVLYDFASYTSGQTRPNGQLLYDGTYLYGTSSGGGANGVGTIFKIKTDGTGYTILRSFAVGSTSGGFLPYGSLVSDSTYLYGTTNSGGSSAYGAIYRIKPDGSSYGVIYNFTGTTNSGKNPYCSLVYDSGYLYGTTPTGGALNNGTVFKVAVNGTGYTNLINFANNATSSSTTTGSNPKGSLYYDGTYLYGMTQWGGLYSLGTMFRVKPDGTGYEKIHDFGSNSSDGAGPLYNNLIGDGTYLYGMTPSGGTAGGIIFKIKPDGTNFTNLYNFSTAGASPYGSLYFDGNYLYGTTYTDGIYGQGTVFRYLINPITTNISSVENDNSFASVYPNPSNGDFEIISPNYRNATLRMYDVNGKLVLSQLITDYAKINATNLTCGVYNVNIISNQGSINKRVVITK
ncbi:MAG: T9SS type A sorting domain-containing protein [Bacteroidota bacterium]|nr:T9SS type A sorting domain-containing protein [Bacteroidota bacterium]